MATLTLENQAKAHWHLWGNGYAMFTCCSSCDEMAYCRGRRRDYMLCLACFDQNTPKGW